MYSDKMVFASARDTGSLGHIENILGLVNLSKLYVSDVGNGV
jgi:hypothetical protein